MTKWLRNLKGVFKRKPRCQLCGREAICSTFGCEHEGCQKENNLTFCPECWDLKGFNFLCEEHYTPEMKTLAKERGRYKWLRKCL